MKNHDWLWNEHTKHNKDKNVGCTLYLVMVLKWLFLKNTQSSPSWTAEVNSHSPWYVNCVAVLFRNCSATNPTKAAHTVTCGYYTLANTRPGNSSSILFYLPLHPHIATSLGEHIQRGDKASKFWNHSIINKPSQVQKCHIHF